MQGSAAVVPTLDPLETVLLYLLDANHGVKSYENFVVNSEINDMSLKLVTNEDYFKGIMKTEYPKEALFIGDFSNSERIYTDDEQLMIKPPHELIGARAEIVMYCNGDDQIRWQLWKRLDCRPKGYVPATLGDYIYYERHFRMIYTSSNYYDYSICIYAWSPRYNRFVSVVKSVKDAVHFKKATDECTDSFKIHASAIDDSLCRYFFHVAIKADITLVFYVDIDAVKELFKLRNNPLTANDRRRPIIHWVCEHLRKKPVNPGFAEIPEHLRGVNEFDFEGLHIKITSPVAKNEKFK